MSVEALVCPDSIKRLISIASIVNLMFLSSLGNANAADRHDGEWNGPATVTQNSRCKSGSVTLTVVGGQATGQAKFDLEARNINGTVRADGSFGGTIGFQHLTGRFIDDRFEGTFQIVACTWILNLRRTRPRTPTSERPSRHPPRAPTLGVMPT